MPDRADPWLPRLPPLHHALSVFQQGRRTRRLPKVSPLGERATLRSFRHTYGTLAAEALGSNQFLVRKMLGHKQISTTARCCHPRAPQIENNPVAAMLKQLEGHLEGCPIIELDFRKAG